MWINHIFFLEYQLVPLKKLNIEKVSSNLCNQLIKIINFFFVYLISVLMTLVSMTI
jgi:hypothetical protein